MELRIITVLSADDKVVRENTDWLELVLNWLQLLYYIQSTKRYQLTLYDKKNIIVENKTNVHRFFITIPQEQKLYYVLY